MDSPGALSFDSFWSWVSTHTNCILRAGTADAVIYDDEYLHWVFATYDGGTFGVQVLNGKRFMGEIFIYPDRVAYVQVYTGEVEGEHVFELITETETERIASYFFVMAHGFGEEDFEVPAGRVH